MEIDGVAMYRSTGENYSCSDGIQWIERIFSDCIDTKPKLLGFIVGSISLALFVVPLSWQLLQNYKAKRSHGLSRMFLFFCLVFFVCCSSSIFGGFQASTIVVPCLAFSSLGSLCLLSHKVSSPRFVRSDFKLSRKNALFLESVSQIWPMFESHGDMIIINYQSRSCEGLSFLMFYVILAANFTYGLSVLLATTDWLFFLRHLPWLAGSLGCVLFDLVVISQYYYYLDRRQEESESGETVNLLEDANYSDW